MKRILLISLAALIIGLAAGWLIFAPGSVHDHSGPSENAAADSVWTCSMHPNVKQPKPGKCPICAMDLIPLSKLGMTAGERKFSMSEAAKKLAHITTTAVVRKHPEVEVRLFGKIEHDVTSMRTISARFPGRIDRLYVDYEGVRVKKGDHLAKIYSPELLSAQTELLSAIRFGNSDSTAAARDKLRLWGFSDERITAIETSGKTSDQLDIDSPLSGVVTMKKVNEGDYVQTGSNMFTIADLSELWVILDAYESDLAWLRFGQSVTFKSEAFGDREFTGKIAFISPEISPATRTAEVRVNVQNADEILKPGMFVRGVVKATAAGFGKVIDPSLAGKWISPMHPEIVKDSPGKCDVCGMDLVKAEDLGYTAIDQETAGPPLVIPASAVLHTGKRSVVYVELPDQKQPHFQGRDVLIGPRAGDEYIILAGLNEGERVVTEGSFRIDSALQIQSDTSMMNPDESSTPLFEKFEVKPEVEPKAQDLFSNYLIIQKALVASDFEAAKSASGPLTESIKALIPTDIASPKWAELREQLAVNSVNFNDSKTLENARVRFEKLSVSIDEFVRRFGIEAYLMHCPMAFDNRGADWLQGTQELVNPYFGERMLHCGTTKEHLNEPTLSDR